MMKQHLGGTLPALHSYSEHYLSTYTPRTCDFVILAVLTLSEQVCGVRPERGHDEGQVYWLGVVVQGYTVAERRCEVLGSKLEALDEYITLRWLEKVPGLDHYRLTDIYDVLWESTSILPIKARLAPMITSDEGREGHGDNAPQRKRAKTASKLYKLTAIAHSQLAALAKANIEL